MPPSFRATVLWQIIRELRRRSFRTRPRSTLGILCLAFAATSLFADEDFGDRQGTQPLIAVSIEGFDDWETEISWFQRFGANAAFTKGRASAKHTRYKSLGYQTVAMPPTLSRVARRGQGRNYWITSYLKSPWQQKDTGALSFSLDIPAQAENRLEGSAYVFAKQLPRDQSVFVQDRESRQFLPRDQWTLHTQGPTVTVHGGVIGKDYRVIFLCGERFRRDRMNIDGVPSGGRASQMKTLERWLARMPDLDVVRATSLNYSFSIVRPENPPSVSPPFIPSRSWYGYQRTTTPDRLQRFQELHGRPFDVRAMTDSCYFEEGYLPGEETWRWINLVREDMRGYARDYAQRVQQAGKRVRLFWGDQWIGIEPHLGDIDAAGIDEVTTALQGPPGRVRDLMAFPGEAKRICRFTLNRGELLKDEDRHAARVRSNWRRWKREMLLACPDGLEYLMMPRDWLESRAGEAYIEVARDFRKVFHHVHGQTPHHTMRICVLNAWGPMRSWGRFPGYESRDVVSNFVDWPVQVEWSSFDEIVRAGVPPEVDLLLIAGEPNTAFSGGVKWRNPKLVDAINSYVRAGGGLLCIGGASFVDGEFALGDLLGVRYAGPPTAHAADELWSENRWNEFGQPPAEYSVDKVTPAVTLALDNKTLPSEVASRVPAAEIDVRVDCKVIAIDSQVIAASPDRAVLCALNTRGAGRTCYLGGYGRYPRFLKVLAHYLGRKVTELDQLDSSSPEVPIYYYPESKLLIAFRAGDGQAAQVRFDPGLAGLPAESRIALQPTSGNKPLFVSSARDGFEIDLQLGETQYWQVEAAP